MIVDAVPKTLFRGVQVNAEYRVLDAEEVGAGNPMIEALPPLLTQEHWAKLLAWYPPVDPSVRALPDELRKDQLCVDLKCLLQPMDEHVEVASTISRMIRLGYKPRNPLDQLYQRQISSYAEAAARGRDMLLEYRSSGLGSGMGLIGISGIGKSTLLEAILARIPQVIWHGHYREHAITRGQLVWLKLDCPLSRNPKGLCRDFFRAVDAVLRTGYARHYKSTRLNEVELLEAMGSIASEQYLGLLVVDEMQNLTASRGRGDDTLQNFLLRMETTLGIPIIRVGTYKAARLTANNFQLGRRECAPGAVEWGRMASDSDSWGSLWRALWRYQYVRHPEPWTAEFDKVFYRETQGITDIAVKLFAMAQMRAMETGVERLSPELVTNVARHDFRSVRAALEVLRSGSPDALMRYEDLVPTGTSLAATVAERMEQAASKAITHAAVAAGAGTSQSLNGPAAQPADIPRAATQVPKKSTPRKSRRAAQQDAEVEPFKTGLPSVLLPPPTP